jgi:hypothetical protein
MHHHSSPLLEWFNFKVSPLFMALFWVDIPPYRQDKPYSRSGVSRTAESPLQLCPKNSVSSSQAGQEAPVLPVSPEQAFRYDLVKRLPL